jgi:hypothetical protein
MDFILNLLKGLIGSVGFDSAKLKDFIWNVFSRGFEVSYEEDAGGKKTFFVSDRVVEEGDGAIKAGLAEPLDGTVIRKAIVTVAEMLWNTLFKESEE